MLDDTAKQSLRESLSALVDDQASELELHRLLKASEVKASEVKESETNTELRSTWMRYQLVSAALKGNTPECEYVDLSDRVRTAIADEAPLSLDSPVTLKSWQRSIGKLAIAASVAGMVVIGVQQSAVLDDISLQANNDALPVNVSLPDLTPTVLFSPAASTVSTVQEGQPQALRRPPMVFIPRTGQKNIATEALQKRINYLMLEHAEHAAQNSGRGMLPFARIPRMEEE